MTVNRSRIHGSYAELREKIGPEPFLISSLDNRRRGSNGWFVAIIVFAIVLMAYAAMKGL